MQENNFEEKFKNLAAFFNLAAHELRTPVTTAKIYLQLMKETSDSEDISYESLNKTEAQLNKLNLLISNILDVSRMHTGKFKIETQTISLTEAVQTAVGARQSALSKFDFQSKYEDVNIEGDRDRVMQLCLNILDNAMKFSKPKSVIKLSVHTDAQHGILQIADEGKGMTAEELNNLMQNDPLQATEKKAGGLGIGFFVSREIAHEMNAEITMQSESGKGSVVNVLFQKSI